MDSLRFNEKWSARSNDKYSRGCTDFLVKSNGLEEKPSILGKKELIVIVVLRVDRFIVVKQ